MSVAQALMSAQTNIDHRTNIDQKLGLLWSTLVGEAIFICFGVRLRTVGLL